jgi:hypothetical protein
MATTRQDGFPGVVVLGYGVSFIIIGVVGLNLAGSH